MKSSVRLVSPMAVLACTGLLLLCGCAGVPNVQQALSQDNAAVVFNYGGIYGPIKIIRCNPRPGQTVTFAADGTFQVGWAGGTNITVTYSNLQSVLKAK